MKPQPLSEKLYEILSKICEGTITPQGIAEVFIRLRGEGKAPEKIKDALLTAGDLEHTTPKNFLTRAELRRTFNWEERALKQNLAKWGLPSSSKIKTYSKEMIYNAAKAAGWRNDTDNGLWIRPIASQKKEL